VALDARKLAAETAHGPAGQPAQPYS
jgi:hypothetical protein